MFSGLKQVVEAANKRCEEMADKSEFLSRATTKQMETISATFKKFCEDTPAGSVDLVYDFLTGYPFDNQRDLITATLICYGVIQEHAAAMRLRNKLTALLLDALDGDGGKGGEEEEDHCEQCDEKESCDSYLSRRSEESPENTN